MSYTIFEIENKILTLLDLTSRPLDVKKLGDYLGESHNFINFSLKQLLREGAIHMESKNGTNFIAKTEGGLAENV